MGESDFCQVPRAAIILIAGLQELLPDALARAAIILIAGQREYIAKASRSGMIAARDDRGTKMDGRSSLA